MSNFQPIGPQLDVTNLRNLNENFESLGKKLEEVSEVSNALLSEVFDNAVLETEIAGRLEDLETRYAPQLTQVNQKLVEIHQFNIMPQAPKPEKQGVKTTSYKITEKVNENTLRVIQKTNKAYIEYTLQKNSGASVQGRDYGTNHELLRIVSVKHNPLAYVYKDISTPTSFTGVFDVYRAAANSNQLETYLFTLRNSLSSTSFGSKSGGLGVDLYRLGANSRVNYTIPRTETNKLNIAMYGTNASSDNLDILLNDIVVKNVNLRSGVVSDGTGIVIIEIDLPAREGDGSVTVSIRNNSSSLVAYIGAINIMELKDYDGRYIDNFKCFGSDKSSGWIDNSGASDYALINADNGLLFGSYHGGEISEICQMYWSTENTPRTIYDSVYTNFNDIPVGSWCVQKNFKINQLTSLIGGLAKMYSVFDFDIDGTLDMSFNYHNATVKLSTFWTALTCTSSLFNKVTSPKYHNFGNTFSNNHHFLDLTQGFVSQVSDSLGLQLDQRFTKFDDIYSSQKASINDASVYRKFYYGVIRRAVGDNQITVNSLQFQKSLDFIVL